MHLSSEDQSWITNTLNSLTPREKIGQLLIPCLTNDTAKPLTIPEMVKQYAPGGGHSFGKTLDEQLILVKSVQQAAKVPMFITGDLERGAGDRIPECTQFAGQLALSAANDESLAYQMGKAIAVEGTAAGFNWVFGPVVDLCQSPESLSTIRSLGENPDHVIRFATQIIKGIQDHNMAACAKHYPGKITGHDDSHLTTPVDNLTRQQWDQLYGRIYKAAIDSDVFSIMSSHIAQPLMDPDSGTPIFPRPATLSKHLLIDILRDELGFAGVVTTDALTMGGLTMHARRLEMHLLALNAGNDMLLFVRRLDSVIDYLEKCLIDGSLSEQRLEQAVTRVLTMKAKIGFHKRPTLPDKEQSRKLLSESPFKADAVKLAEKSITLLRNDQKIIPCDITPQTRIASVLITNREEDFTLDVFNKTLASVGPKVTAMTNPNPDEIYDDIEAGKYDIVITSFYYPPQWGWSTNRAHGPYIRCLMTGYPFANPDTRPIFISFANPFHLNEFRFMDPYIATYGGAPATQQAVARAILNQHPFNGTPPISLDPLFKAGVKIE